MQRFLLLVVLLHAANEANAIERCVVYNIFFYVIKFNADCKLTTWAKHNFFCNGAVLETLAYT